MKKEQRLYVLTRLGMTLILSYIAVQTTSKARYRLYKTTADCVNHQIKLSENVKVFILPETQRLHIVSSM